MDLIDLTKDLSDSEEGSVFGETSLPEISLTTSAGGLR